MRQTLLILLVAHLVADFLLQTGWIARKKRELPVLLLHVGLVGLAVVILLGAFPLLLLITLLASHGVLDAFKTRFMPESIWTFFADQAAHVAVVIGLAIMFPGAASSGLWLAGLQPEGQRIYLMTITLLGGILLAVPAGGVMIGMLTNPLLKEIQSARQKRQAVAIALSGSAGEELTEEADDGIEGLQKGGRYIGWLERALIMLLLFMNQASSIGFLFAAKSILRYGEIKNPHQRKVAEYIIIGTLLSFGWGLLATFITQQVLRVW